MNQHARRLLHEWQESRPRNFYASNRNLRTVLGLLSAAAPNDALHARLSDFGQVLSQEVDALVTECDRLENQPRLRSWSGIGERIDQIDFHPDYHQAGRRIWRSGVLSVSGERGHSLEQAALFYLLSHLGEGGHACPVACTAGLIKALQAHGSSDLKEHYLSRLLDRDYDSADRGSQFLTEVQGGSDVGANACVAAPDRDEPGRWRITGEKWFCSVADADQFFVTARVAGSSLGTEGLGAFLVPRRLDNGSLNCFTIRRLKIKLGTRAMASGEIDFAGALAWPIGRPSDGIKIAVGIVLNTSRWLNALGSAGVMRRAYLEAATYAATREAFGAKIGSYPMVRETLAAMKCDEHAALASTLYLTTLIDRIETARADEHEKALYRFLVNANKYITSIAASDVTHAAMEVLGGNGTIEDFSIVPRLLRDNLVFESWEGTHNVLCQQVLRDCARLALFPNVHDEITTLLESLEDAELRSGIPALVEIANDLSARMTRSIRSPEHGRTHFRRQLTQFLRLFQAARLLWEADREKAAGDGRVKAAVAQFFVRRHLLGTYRPESDANWNVRIDTIVAEDLEIAT